MAAIGIHEDTAGGFRWRIRSGSDTIADDSEGYSSRSAAHDGLTSVNANAPGAAVQA